MKAIALAFLLSPILLAQQQSPPPLEVFRQGELTAVASHQGPPSYEYTVFDGGNDSFTGLSEKPLKLRLNARVKFAINGLTVHFVDEDGKVQETLLIRQAETVRVVVPPK